MAETKKAKGIIAIEINVTCPHCDEENDVYYQDHELFKDNVLPDPETFKHETFFCDNCGGEFLLTELEY